MNPADTADTVATRSSRTILVSFLGAVVRRHDNWMPIAGAVELLGQLGLDEAGVRTAVSRLKRRDWLVPEPRGGVRGYALSATALTVLADGDDVIWRPPGPAAASDGWCIVNVSVPESARAVRHQLRTRLTGQGFGKLGSAVWIAPARRRPAAERVIAELGLVEQSAVFVGDYASGPRLASLVRQSWDLDAIDARYREFLDRHPQAPRRVTAGAEPFIAYLTVIDDWRTLPFADPGLPLELLGRHWPGPRAGRLFEQLATTLEAPALAHARQYWPVPAHP